MANKQSSRPADAYKAIIDQLATETTTGVSEKLVTTEGLFSKAADDAALNSFVRGLPLEHRTLLAKMLCEERQSAIHDVLAVLSWWVDAGDLCFTLRGEPMPVGISGMGLHGDYVGRRNGWQWPDEEACEPPPH